MELESHIPGGRQPITETIVVVQEDTEEEVEKETKLRTTLEQKLGVSGAVEAICIYLTKDEADIVMAETIRQTLDRAGLSLLEVELMLARAGFRKLKTWEIDTSYRRSKKVLDEKLAEIELLVEGTKFTYGLTYYSEHKQELQDKIREIEAKGASGENPYLSILLELLKLLNDIETRKEKVGGHQQDEDMQRDAIVEGSSVWARPGGKETQKNWEINSKLISVDEVVRLVRDHIDELSPKFF